jgi:hypothetical protein
LQKQFAKLETQVMRKTFKLLSLLSLAAAPGLAGAQQWVSPEHPPNFNVGIALQLTDGNIMVQQNGTSNWWKLVPDNFGEYHKGQFVPLASFPAGMGGYAPLYFASAVLPDGKVIVEGGEYNGGGAPVWTTLGAIYNPVTNVWTQVAPPPGWTQIGDAQSVVLDNGTFMMANIDNGEYALLDEATLSWTVFPGKGKFDANDEEGWTLLPGGKVLTVDTYLFGLDDPTGTNSEIFTPATNTWSSAGSTVAQLWDSRLDCGEVSPSHEMGPAVLRPNGTVFATGANTCGKPGHTAIYDVATKKWKAGPNFPGVEDIADGPASILTNGHVLVDTSPGYGNGPSTLYEFNGTKFLKIPQPKPLNSPPSNTEGGRMLVTPTGSVLFLHVDTPEMWFYSTSGTYENAWRPHICAACYPAVGFIGGTYKVSGTQFNGLTQGAAFGDDAQSATNYPLVRIQNAATGHIFYARTHSFSTMAIATGSLPTSCEFDILPGTETGDSNLTVIANGIPSNTVGFKVVRPIGAQ